MKMTGSLNKMLLENILPVHVADYFMGGNKQSVSTQISPFIMICQHETEEVKMTGSLN